MGVTGSQAELFKLRCLGLPTKDKQLRRMMLLFYGASWDQPAAIGFTCVMSFVRGQSAPEAIAVYLLLSKFLVKR